MFPYRDKGNREPVAAVTITIAFLMVVIYLWDRQWGLFGPGITFADLTMRPREVVMTVTGQSGDAFSLVTVLTSIFLHGNLIHLFGNLIFLLVFGPGVENAVGASRFSLYYLLWGVAAAATQIYTDPMTNVPILGASGAIGGILGAYLLLFPGNKIEIVFPVLLFYTKEVSAWILLVIWFLFQVFVPVEGVANWAHAGGFLAGMLTVLLLGGRKRILKDRPELTG